MFCGVVDSGVRRAVNMLLPRSPRLSLLPSQAGWSATHRHAADYYEARTAECCTIGVEWESDS